MKKTNEIPDAPSGLRKVLPAVTPEYSTKLGAMFQGECEKILSAANLRRKRGKVQMLFTSPPFALQREKKYGNVAQDKYVEWLAGYATLFSEYLTPDGSIVLELGNAWEPSTPTMSTLPLKALLAFQERANLHLCQEFICYNPARLPSPVEWVARRRIRVKDAFTRVWWLSPNAFAKADNRRILTEYSSSMRALLKRGTYNPGRRPSEHHIGATSFLTDNGGAIPPNVLISTPIEQNLDLFEVLPISNTNPDDLYQKHTRSGGLESHPARMPAKLVEFFVQFLTTPGDLVLDPFAGSNTTGAVCESLKRKWISIEKQAAYVEGSISRFPRAEAKK